jgi:2-oxoglutarate ferredoxin oxidoreductase subunit alpha
MHADPKGVLTGVHFFDGDHACCEGTLAAGARFAAGYPITPSTEVVERFALRIPIVGGIFIQMEDELAASIAIIGAVWGGAKAFTVTSGPGFSLMMEHIGYAAITETPCVFVDVQRGGPSTGLPTLPAQADMMHGAVGIARGLQHHCALPEFAAGMLRSDDHGVQPGGRVPRAGDGDAR